MADLFSSFRVLTGLFSRRRVGARFHYGFTLIELLVVIAIIAVLSAILFPVMTSAQHTAKKVKCASNIKQIATAIILYTDDNDSHYVPAAPDYDSANLKRWHGARDAYGKEFEPRKGPLWVYLNRCGGLKVCPTAAKMKSLSDDPSAFEDGCGCYGYNMYYVGGTYYRNNWPECTRVASATSDIARPSKTILLADAAIPVAGASGQPPHLIEYSFCEPPYMVFNGEVITSFHSTPSIHFRHNGAANVAWCDGHISSERMSHTTEGTTILGGTSKEFDVGWFGPDDNSLFDVQ